MKVLAFNCSPKGEKGNTAMILTPFIEGIREAGAEVELLYTRKLNIKPCRGCWICMLKTPGKCFRKDDMQMVLPKLREADIWIFATPVQSDGVSGPMKNMMDRMMPLALPLVELRDGHCRYRLHEGVKHSKTVLVSSCGNWETDNFDPLVVHIKAFCRTMDGEFAGALLRPHAEALVPMMETGEKLDDVFQAAQDAGRQLGHDGRMSAKTLNIVSRELMPLDKYVQLLNEGGQQALDALER